MLTSSSLLLFVLLVVRCSSLVACWFHSPLFFFFLALLLLPYVILWKKTLPIRLPPPFLLQKPVPLFSFKMSFFLSPCEWAAPCARVPLFQMVWPLFLPCQFPLSLIFCAGFRKGPKVRCRLASAIPPALSRSDTPPHHFLSHAKSQKCREDALLTFILLFLIFIIFTLFFIFFQKE